MVLVLNNVKFCRYIVKKKQDSLWNLIEGAHDAWSGWLCVLLVGLFTGAVAGVIDIGASWMTDLKFGICPQAFWLNREQCCWSSNETSFEAGNCSQVSCFAVAGFLFLRIWGIYFNVVFFSVVDLARSFGTSQAGSRGLYSFLYVLYNLGPTVCSPFGFPGKDVRSLCLRIWYS